MKKGGVGKYGKTIRDTGEREFWQSAKDNKIDWQYYYERLIELAVSMFEWKNLPDSIDPRYLELTLFSEGKAVYFNDEVLGNLALRCMIGGTWDVYQIPTLRTAFSSNGYHKSLNEENSVIIFNNMLHTDSVMPVIMYAKRLYEIDRTIDVNVQAQKTPVFIQCDETERLTMKNLYEKYTGNQPFIFGDKNMNPNSLKVLKTDAPYVADKLFTLKTQIWNEALTYLGIANVSFQKKERMISNEVMSNMGSTVANRHSKLESRREAVKKINKMFGTNIEVDFRSSYPDDMLEYEQKVKGNVATPLGQDKKDD